MSTHNRFIPKSLSPCTASTHPPSPFISILSNTRLVKSSGVNSWFSLPLIARMAWRRKSKISMPHWDQELLENSVLQEHDGLCLYNVEELVSVDAAVSIHIIKFEIPAQLVLHLSPHHQAEGSHILHEIYVAVLQVQAERWDLCTKNSTNRTSILFYAWPFTCKSFLAKW